MMAAVEPPTQLRYGIDARRLTPRPPSGQNYVWHLIAENAKGECARQPAIFVRPAGVAEVERLDGPRALRRPRISVAAFQRRRRPGTYAAAGPECASPEFHASDRALRRRQRTSTTSSFLRVRSSYHGGASLPRPDPATAPQGGGGRCGFGARCRTGSRAIAPATSAQFGALLGGLSYAVFVRRQFGATGLSATLVLSLADSSALRAGAGFAFHMATPAKVGAVPAAAALVTHMAFAAFGPARAPVRGIVALGSPQP